MRFWSLLLYLGLLLTVSSGQVTLEELLADTEVVKAFDWEWILIQINGVGGILPNTDYLSAADTQVIVTAIGAVTPEIALDTPISKFESFTVGGDNTPEWFQIGVVAYQRGSVATLDVILKEHDPAVDDQLVKTTINVPAEYDTWVNAKAVRGDFSVDLSLYRTTTPIFTEEEQNSMNLQEEIFDLADGSKAVLAYSVAPSNQKAILYLPGKEDAFAHPHVLKMYQERGYDFFTLDLRTCGRARRFMDPTEFLFSHYTENFDEYKEEIEMALEFIRNQNKTYTRPLAHTHSTGSLVALNYALLVDEEPFQGYILNAPFLDWGRQSRLNEFLLKNSEYATWFGIDYAQEQNSLVKYHVVRWIINRFNTSDRPIISGHTTLKWAQAATDIHNKIIQVPTNDPITSAPVLLIASKGDQILDARESVERMPHIATNYSKAILDYNSHDVTLSMTKEMDDQAIAIISAWLDNPEPTEFGESGGRATRGMGIMSIIFSGVIGFLSFL